MWVLAIVDPAVYATPYIIGLIVCSFIFLALFLRFPSLRSYRKKRNLMVYAVMALVFVLLVFQAHDVALGLTHVSYGFDLSTNEFRLGKVNQFNITSSNAGIRAANYYLVLTGVNASFAHGNLQEYIRINSTVIKIPFSFVELKKASESKPIFFEINQNVTSFSFSVDIEPKNDSSILVVTWTGSMRCFWNSTRTCYTIDELSTVTA